MAVVVAAPPALSGELSLFHTTDPLLSNSPVLIFHGPAATIGATSSRIQVHIFTPVGYGSYARLAVSPNSPFYSAVSNLPREEQGDEVCRGLAFGLKRYFKELPEAVKKTWCTEAKAPSPSALFGDEHIAILASRMTKIENVEAVIGELKHAFVDQKFSWLDIDVVLPSGSIKQMPNNMDLAGLEDFDESQHLVQRYGIYAELIDCLGESAFLPTSKLKRAPSRPVAIGRSVSFLRNQKESVHKELNELVDTEGSYVERIANLENLSNSVGADLKSSSQNLLRSIFPASLHDIVGLNSSFLESLRTVFDVIEQDALHDIEAMQDEQPTARQARQDFVEDTQGIGLVARCLCEWFPKFRDSYRDYLGQHARSAEVLRNISRGADSAVTAHLQDIGEQKLTSLLIEPVQRLPRYNLYIDSIVKQLPVRHPATKPLLMARDIITEICDQGDPGPAAIVERLRSRVSGWPEETQVAGRLVTAADFVEVTPPYVSESCNAATGILLLFTDGLVFLEKRSGSATPAKTLLTEIESGQTPMRSVQTRPRTPHDLLFSRRVHLSSVDCLESHHGQMLQIMTQFKLDEAARPAQQMRVDSCQMLRLEGLYEGKAERLSGEIIKASVEGRFSESEREDSRWEARISDPAADSITIFSAVFDDSCPDHVNARSTTAAVRILVDIDKHAQRPRAGQNGLCTVMSLSPMRDGLWRLAIDSVHGSISPEHVAIADLIPTMRRKLTTLASAQFGIEQAAMTACLIHKNGDILQSVNILASLDDSELETQSLRKEQPRSKSPKKMLSSFLSSTGPGNQPPAFLKKDLPPLPPPSRPTTVQYYHVTQKPPSRESRPASKDHPTTSSVSSMRSGAPSVNPIRKLEDSLSAYMLALQARKGNIVGRNLKLRASADELAVNELYNSLLEDPNMMVLAAQATVDVLFVAFEKFLNVAWKEQVGQVLPLTVLQDIQSRAETLFPADFDQYFKRTLGDLPPQNQRAFKGIMKLLADLLDGTGNDGDRGILTAAFAGLLVPEGNPHDYIALIDRFVDDPDTYFGEPLEDAQQAVDGSVNANKRARSVNSASISSNTSSLRKKFGFSTLSRENSKSEQESKVASVWRTLSKTARGDASPANSISKGTLQRSYSTDNDVRPLLTRPTSSGGASTHKSSNASEDSSLAALSTAHSLGLSTIGEHPSFIPTQPPRKKRRSSLSDLKALEVSQPKSPAWSPPASRRPPMTHRYMEDKSLPNSPMPSTPSSKGGSGRFGTPLKDTPRSRLPSSFRGENSPGPARSYATPEQRPKSSGGKLDEVVITARPTSNIPMLAPRTGSQQKATSPAPARSGLAERPGAGNIIKKPSPQQEKSGRPAVSGTTDDGSPKKLRMQSPQKIRERLQNEQSAVTVAHASLQDELSKIGDELTSTPSRYGSIRSTNITRTGSKTNQSNTMDLAQRVLKMEGQLPKQVEDLHTRINSIQSDLSTSLSVSETKCKKLDELYREANGENEALYMRFNDELSRILKAVKGGEGVEELKKKLRESQEEAAKLKRETSRLKRENVGLRAQLKE